MKNIFRIALLVFLGACGQKEKSINNGEIVDSLQPKITLAIKPIDTLVDSSGLIIPGKSIGQVYLNERGDSIFSKLGKPDTGDAAMGKSVSIYKNKENGSEFKIYFITNMGEPAEAPSLQLYDTVKEGIAFEINTENICKGITLHLGGEALQPTYLPFYQSFELIKK